MSTKLTTCFAIISLSLLTGCYNLQTKDNLTPFPDTPAHLPSPHNMPVVSYDSTNNTYVVTKPMLLNAGANQRFVDEVLMWKRDNGVR